MGNPLVKLFRKIHFGKHSLPNTACAFLTLISLLTVIISLVSLVVPMFMSQVEVISSIDSKTFTSNLKEPLQSLQSFLISNGLIFPNTTVEELASSQVIAYFNFSQFTNVFGYFFGFAGNVFMAFFSISFITFFLLRDERMFVDGVMLITPIDYQTEVKHILFELQRLLTRYFIGLCIDILIVITLLSIGMTIFGVKNALIIAVLAGLMNIIPYVGPFIGAAVGALLVITGNISGDFSQETLPMIFKMLGIMVTVNLLDGMVLQPYIYSNSVKAHPLEIFIVIMLAGSLAGIPGMILAIPTYTVIRIVAKEFFTQFRVVKKLTENI